MTAASRRPSRPTPDEEADRLFAEAVVAQGIDLDAPGDPAIVRPLARMVEAGLARAAAQHRLPKAA